MTRTGSAICRARKPLVGMMSLQKYDYQRSTAGQVSIDQIARNPALDSLLVEQWRYSCLGIDRPVFLETPFLIFVCFWSKSEGQTTCLGRNVQLWHRSSTMLNLQSECVTKKSMACIICCLFRSKNQQISRRASQGKRVYRFLSSWKRLMIVERVRVDIHLDNPRLR